MKKVLTLCIIHQGDKVLLGMKKRGFGEGRWNGFGGKVAEGEGIQEAAKRELSEEAGVTANKIKQLGVLDFSWKGKEDKILQVHIFKCQDFKGNPTESEEMRPEWFLIKDIPYEKMWSSDTYWYKPFLENKKFEGNFLFDESDQVLKYNLNES